MQNNLNNLDNAPFNPSTQEFLYKLFVWLVTGIIISFLIFVLFVLFWNLIQQAISVSKLSTTWWDLVTVSPLVSIVILLIWFLAGLFGSIIIWISYNFVLSDRYYDIWKMFSFSLVSNWLILFLFAFLYFLYNSNIDALIIILIFHIWFSLYISLQWYDHISNPNYSLFFLFSHSISFLLVIFLSILWYKFFDKFMLWSQWSLASLLIYFLFLLYILYPIIIYLLEKVYYKIYESSSNPFYTPSLNEILVDEEVVDEVNVEIDN